MIGQKKAPQYTRLRLLQAAESLFLTHGYEAMSVRQITSRAEANLSAVNYYFGSKDELFRELLASRLEPLGRARLELFQACSQRGLPLNLDTLLCISLVPLFELSRGADGAILMRMLRRAYADPSPTVRRILDAHHKTAYAPLFDAFAAVLPDIPRGELGIRIGLCMLGLAALISEEDLTPLFACLHLHPREPTDEAAALAKLSALVGPLLTGPLPAAAQRQTAERVLAVNEARRQAPAIAAQL